MKKIIAIAASLLAAACSVEESSPLIFGQGLTVGISIGAPATNGPTPELVVGLKMADIAIVPTVIPKEIPLPPDQTSRNIRSHGEEKSGGGKGANGNDIPLAGKEDALSTFGSFSNQTKTDCVTLGVFFATGVAAQNISEGFKESLKNGKSGEC